MRLPCCAFSLVALTIAAGWTTGCGNRLRALESETPYTIAFTSFGPLNTDVFIADGSGANAKAFLPSPFLDYNASLSADGEWVVFTSDRNGSADIYRARRDGSDLTRLTDDPAFDDQAALSPDGRHLASVSTRTGNADIWILDLQSRRRVNLTHHPAGDFRPAWSPDGQWLAFSSDRNSEGLRLGFFVRQLTKLYVVKRDGSGLRRVSQEEGVAGTPAWSRDGRSIVYYQGAVSEVRDLTAPAKSAGTTQLVVLDVAGGKSQVVTSGPGPKVFPRWLDDGTVGYFERTGDGHIRFTDGRSGSPGEFQHATWTSDGRHMVYHREVGHEWPPFHPVYSRDRAFRLIRSGLFPHFSPDGSRLAMSSARVATPVVHNGIAITNGDGTSPAMLFDDPQRSALAPVWSPRGDRIAFGLGRFFPMTQGLAPADVAVLNADNRELTVLTDGSTNAGFPSWSPDGERLVYREWRKDGSRLLIIDARTKSVTPLLANFGNVNFPSWSPDGRLVQFTSDRDGNYELYTIELESQRIARLTHSPGNDAHAAWSPDGRWIVFSSVRQGFKDEGALYPGNPQGAGDLYVMRADGSDVRILTDNPFEDATPTWAPLRRR